MSDLNELLQESREVKIFGSYQTKSSVLGYKGEMKLLSDGRVIGLVTDTIGYRRLNLILGLYDGDDLFLLRFRKVQNKKDSLPLFFNFKKNGSDFSFVGKCDSYLDLNFFNETGKIRDYNRRSSEIYADLATLVSKEMLESYIFQNGLKEKIIETGRDARLNLIINGDKK
jgi:hypothetical protein